MTDVPSRQSKWDGPAPREFCDKHRTWYTPSRDLGDGYAVPCPGCVTEAEAHGRECEDHNIRAMLGMLPRRTVTRSDDVVVLDPEAIEAARDYPCEGLRVLADGDEQEAQS